MKAARFAFERPASLADLLARLGAGAGACKLIAGGQSLGPILNLRLAEPDLLLDITGIAELRTVSREAGTLVLGACVTHADIEDGRVPDLGQGILARVAAGIAYRPVRNRGTIGGSLVHADPAADWVNALTLLDAEVEMASARGLRRLPLERFVTGALATALAPDEVLVRVHLPAVPDGAAWGYVKHSTKVGEFAHAIGAVLLHPPSGRGGALIGALDRAPLLVRDAGRLFGGRIGADFADRFDAAAADALLVEAGVTDRVDRHVHVTVLARAVTQAAACPVPDADRTAA